MEPTAEQIEAAAKELWRVTLPKRSDPKEDQWDNIEECYKEEWRVWARAAAPFLQMPWESPSDKETSDIYAEMKTTGFGVYAIIASFVRRRNAALLPKPVDPRRKKVKAVLESRWPVYPEKSRAVSDDDLADRIIAALDEK